MAAIALYKVAPILRRPLLSQGIMVQDQTDFFSAPAAAAIEVPRL